MAAIIVHSTQCCAIKRVGRIRYVGIVGGDTIILVEENNQRGKPVYVENEKVGLFIEG